MKGMTLHNIKVYYMAPRHRDCAVFAEGQTHSTVGEIRDLRNRTMHPCSTESCQKNRDDSIFQLCQQTERKGGRKNGKSQGHK